MTLAADAREMLERQRYQRSVKRLDAAQRSAITAEIQALLKQNRAAVNRQLRGSRKGYDDNYPVPGAVGRLSLRSLAERRLRL